MSCPSDLAQLAPDRGDQQATENKALVPCVSAALTMQNL